MDKVADAAGQQIAAINAVGLDSLPEGLRTLAELRLQNPFDSLRELGQKLTPPLSRSGVNHRLEKIIDRSGVIRRSERIDLQTPGTAG